MTEWAVLLPMLMMGLVSSGHCIGMCGGIMGALTMAIPNETSHERIKILLAYNVGRITSYGVMGFLVGLIAQQLIVLGGASGLRIFAGLLLIAMGLYLADWWHGLTRLESAGRYLWAYLQPLSKYLLPVTSWHKALLLGALWGWLPCGLIYSALALAITQPTPWLAASSMLSFGVGTLPAVLLAGVASQQLAHVLRQREVRFGLALLIIAYGCWTIYGSLGGHAHHQMTEPQSSESVSESEHHHHHHVN